MSAFLEWAPILKGRKLDECPNAHSDYYSSLGIKFHLKPTTLIFWTKFAQKQYFWLKTEKANSPIEFSIFELN